MGQCFLNGSFEKNILNWVWGGGSGMANHYYDSVMYNSTSFGGKNVTDSNGIPNGVSNVQVYHDIGADGNWYISLTSEGYPFGDSPSDSISLQLSSPVIAGNSYGISFYVAGGSNPGYILMGLSTNDSTFGKLLYTSSECTDWAWTNKTFQFSAPFSANFITISISKPQSNNFWGSAGLDNFTINDCSHTTNLGNDTAICKGSSLKLHATNPYSSYLWQDNSADSTFTITQAGTYWVTVSNACGIITDTIHVSTYLPPTLQLTHDTTICSGQVLTLQASGAETYKWYRLPSSIAVSDSSTLAIAPTNTSNYRVVGTTNTNGIYCSNSDTILVNVKPKPTTPNILGSSIVMVNQSNVYSVINHLSNSYNWFLPDGIINNGNGTDSVNVKFTSMGMKKISVVEIQNNCPSDTSSKTIEVINEPNGFNYFKLSPNPTDGIVNIEFETAESPINIEIFDMIGKSLMRINTNHSGGLFKETLNLSPMSEAIYLVKISTNENTKTVKVLLRY